MRHRRQDRLHGVTPPSHGGNQQADLNHLCIHTTTARGACCREAVQAELRLVDLQANPKPISHQPKHNSRVIVIARGGGSLERLQPFNSLEVAKAIYSSKIPVMTAIGHESDITIADLVADVRASVPMDAGQRLGESWIKASERIETVEQNMLSSFRNTCRTLDAQLTVYSDNFFSSYAKCLTHCRKQVDSFQHTLMRCFRDILRRMQSIEANFSHNDERFASRLATERHALDAREQVLLRETGHFFTRLATRLDSLAAQFRNSHTRYRRFLLSLQGDIAAYEAAMQREAKQWYGAIARRIRLSDSSGVILVAKALRLVSQRVVRCLRKPSFDATRGKSLGKVSNPREETLILPSH